MRYRLNPFTKPLQDIRGEDLLPFKSIYEGWNADYKRQCQKVEDVAKSLSSFANQFGGWLLIGVDEGNPKTMKADSFPGISLDAVPAVLEKLRTAATRHVSPPLYFESTVIHGPSTAINLASGQAIVVVGIPEGSNPPYIHSSGRVYRRQADSCEPLEETSRSVLDMLWSRSQESSRKKQEFISAPVSQRQYIESHIYFVSDMSFEAPSVGLAFRDYQRLLAEPIASASFGIQLSTFYPANDSYVARPADTPRPSVGPAFRWWLNGNARLTIPIASIEPRFESYSQDPLLRRFTKALETSRDRSPQLADLRKWFLGVVALTDKYHHIRDHLDIKTPFYAKVRFRNVSGVTPYINLPSYVSGVEQYGVPTCEEDDIEVPSSRFLRIDANESIHWSVRSAISVMPLVVPALRALGVPFGFDDNIDNIVDEFINASIDGAKLDT